MIEDDIPEVYFNGLCKDLELSTYTIVNVALPLNSSKSQLIDFHLDLNNIACSKGSACQSGVSNGSHVLDSLKRNDQIINRPSLRFSFSSFNTKKEIDYVMKILAELKEN